MSSRLLWWCSCIMYRLKEESISITYHGPHGPLYTENSVSMKTNWSYSTHGPSTLKTTKNSMTSSKIPYKWSLKTLTSSFRKTRYLSLTLSSTLSFNGYWEWEHKLQKSFRSQIVWPWLLRISILLNMKRITFQRKP